MQRRSDADYDDRRGSARERGYTREWDRASKAFKQQHPLCAGCEAIGRTVPADLVDHVIPHKGDQVLFWDQANWQSSCRWHHDVVKQQLELQHAAGKLTALDLFLTSTAAIKLTKAEGSRIGSDGWPIG